LLDREVAARDATGGGEERKEIAIHGFWRYGLLEGVQACAFEVLQVLTASVMWASEGGDDVVHGAAVHIAEFVGGSRRLADVRLVWHARGS